MTRQFSKSQTLLCEFCIVIPFLDNFSLTFASPCVAAFCLLFSLKLKRNEMNCCRCRWLDDGASRRIDRLWTTTNWADLCATTTRKVSCRRWPASVTSIGLPATRTLSSQWPSQTTGSQSSSRIRRILDPSWTMLPARARYLFPMMGRRH